MDPILQTYLDHTGEGCPHCGHSLGRSSRCHSCGSVAYLALAGTKPRKDLLTRKWNILFIPWFLLCYVAITDWLEVLVSILVFGNPWATAFLPPVMDLRIIVYWSSGWIETLSPLVCLYLWLDRPRVNKWPLTAIWVGFGIAVFAWLVELWLLLGMF